MLEIRLLGNYEVRRDGALVEIASRPARMLLAYLALTTGTPHPREKVAGILWPDSEEASARGNLRQALWRLRKAIGVRYLPADNKVVAFDRGPESWLDFALLQEPQDSDLVAAVSAYKGELLPGYYEDWVLLERERLRAAFERKTQRLLDLLQQQRAWPDVLRWAEHWIAFGQVPEPAFRALMIAHAAQGDLAAVASAYERCLSDLQLNIGVEPSEKTRALYDRLIQGEGLSTEDQVALEDAESKPGPRHNLPLQSTPLIGRERELAEARQLLSATRLLTILGPGGMGKTRLALELATQMIDQFRNGVYFISLAPIGSAAYLIQTIAETIGFPLSTDESPKHQLLRHLRNRQYLLLMDNFEHLLDGAGLVAEILQASRNVTILVTSRERLNLQRESLLRIDGLAYPRTHTIPKAPDYDSVRLFVDSARRLKPDFTLDPSNLPDVIRICDMAQGMPLGILLAAAWVDMLSPTEIADEMNQSLDFLQSEWRDTAERHRSIRAAFESSWRRMTRAQRELLAMLAVFRGGFTPEAAREVTGASLQGLADLVHKSLIWRDLESGRYEIHELLRQFAWKRLEARHQAREAVAEEHAIYFANYMEQRWEHLTGFGQLAALAEIKADLENVRRSWRYWLKRHDSKRIRQFLDSLWRVYEFHGWFNDGAILFADAAAALRLSLNEATDTEAAAHCETAYARALAHQATCMAHLGEVDVGLALAEESVIILRRLNRFDELALPLITLWWNASYGGQRTVDMDFGRDVIEIALEQSGKWMHAYALTWLGREAGQRRDHETATRQLEESQRLFVERGDMIVSIWPSIELGNVAISRGAFEEARQHYERAMRATLDCDYQWGLAKATRYLGIFTALIGDYEAAKTYLGQCLRLADDLGLPRDVFKALYELAVVEAVSGDKVTAVWLLAFIQSHPLSDQTRTISIWTDGRFLSLLELANEKSAELKSHLPPEIYAAAVERGRASTLESVVLKLSSLR